MNSAAVRGMKACFFDLDGTLVDSEPMWASALLASLEDIGCPLPKEEVDELVYGRSWLDIYSDLSRILSSRCPERGDLEGRIDRYFGEAKLTSESTIASSVALFRQIAKIIPVAIVSGSGRQMVGELMRELGIAECTEFYLGCEDYPVGKPDPRCYRLAAERLEVAPQECLVFEDSTAGVAAAKAAGMYCVALQRTDARPQDLTGADCVVNDLAELEFSGLLEYPPVFGKKN